MTALFFLLGIVFFLYEFQTIIYPDKDVQRINQYQEKEYWEDKFKNEEKEECIKLIMQELECEEDEALKVYNEIALSETKTVVDKMVKDGLLEIIGHNEDGEPLFGLTELGKAVRSEMEKGK